MSILRPETIELLRSVKKCAPLFPNMVVAELFEAAHTRGTLKILPRTVGGYVLFDESASINRGVRGEFATLEEAQAALERAADGR